jgi:hypothetical protein
MVAVACSHCGELHRTGYVPPDHPAPATAARGHPGPVWDVPVLARPPTSPRLRTSVVYAKTRPRPPAPRALPAAKAAPRRPLVQMIQEVINRSAPADLEPGTRVVVRNQFNGRWTPGFSVHEVLDDGYRVRRDHTGAVLPAVFVRRDVAANAP